MRRFGPTERDECVMRPHVKICGVKTETDIDTVLGRGGGEVGFVHFGPSPRHLELEAMIRLRAHVAGRALVSIVTVDADDETLRRIAGRVRPDTIQLHGGESPARVAEISALTGVSVTKAIAVSAREDLEAVARFRPVADRILLDAKRPKGSALPGGNGVAFDWSLLDALGEDRRFLLSGGINPANVAEAVRRVRPQGIDVSSGVESAPGRKDAGLIHHLFDALDAAFAADAPDADTSLVRRFA